MVEPVAKAQYPQGIDLLKERDPLRIGAVLGVISINGQGVSGSRLPS
jgi:hypothetical protein